MPNGGGLLDQPGATINKMDAVLRARGSVEDERMRKVKAEQDLEAL
jgi:hypothetical protein